jgi:hypothetical protein
MAECAIRICACRYVPQLFPYFLYTASVSVHSHLPLVISSTSCSFCPHLFPHCYPTTLVPPLPSPLPSCPSSLLTPFTDPSQHNRHPRRAAPHARNYRPRRSHRSWFRRRRLGNLRRVEDYQHHRKDGICTKDHARREGPYVCKVEQGGGNV